MATVTSFPLTTRSFDGSLPVISTGSTENRTLSDRFSDQYNIKDFGAVCDGVTDDAAAINAAAQAASDNGGGIVVIPQGTILVGKYETNSDSGTQNLAIKFRDKVFFKGAGRNATTIKLKDGSNAHVFYGFGVSDCGVSDLGINGNRSSQTEQNPSTGNDPAGIILIGTVNRIHLSRLYIHDTCDYGIGFEGVGKQSYCTVEDIILYGTGADAFDNKNNTHESTGNWLRNITVLGLNPSVGNGSTQSAINMRNGWSLDGAYIYGLSDDDLGIHAQGSLTADDGSNEHHITNFWVTGSGGTTRGVYSYGNGTQISNGYINGCYIGLDVQGRDHVCSNIHIRDVTTSGVRIVKNANASEAKNNMFSNIVVRAADATAFSLAATAIENYFVNCVSVACNKAIEIASGANSNVFVGGGCKESVTSDLTNSGSYNRFIGVAGINDKALTVASASTINLGAVGGALIDVTGNTTISAVTLADGATVLVRFTGTPQITNGPSLIVQGGTQTMAAGDYALFAGYALSVVRCTIFRQSGKATVPSAFSDITSKPTTISGYGITDAIAKNVEDQALTGGFIVTSKDLGTISSGTVTPDPGGRPLQHYTNNGAHTLAPSSNTGSTRVDITNGASAGAITTSGFTFVTGDAFTTTNGHKFRCTIEVGNAGSTLTVLAMQ